MRHSPPLGLTDQLSVADMITICKERRINVQINLIDGQFEVNVSMERFCEEFIIYSEDHNDMRLALLAALRQLETDHGEMISQVIC